MEIEMEIADLRLQLGLPEVDQIRVLARLKALEQRAGELLPDLLAGIGRGIFSSGSLFVPIIVTLKSQDLLNCVMSQFGQKCLSISKKCELLNAGFVGEFQPGLLDDLYQCFQTNIIHRDEIVTALAKAGTKCALGLLRVIEARVADRISKLVSEMEACESDEEMTNLVAKILREGTSLACEQDFLQKVQDTIKAVGPRPDPEPPQPESATTTREGFENSHQEYKSSLRWDLRQNKKNEDLEMAVIKTIAAFGNTAGGTLHIGVDDKGTPLGLQNDFKSFTGGGDRDKFERHLRSLISKHISPAFCAQNVKVNFPVEQAVEVCHVIVLQSLSPLFVKDGQNTIFYVRDGNRSVPLQGEEMMFFCRQRNPKFT